MELCQLRCVCLVRGKTGSPSTVPQVQRQVPHELDMTVLHINRSAQSADIFGDVVAEDDGAHGRLSRPALPHQEDLSLLLADVHGDVLRGLISRAGWTVPRRCGHSQDERRTAIQQDAHHGAWAIVRIEAGCLQVETRNPQ